MPDQPGRVTFYLENQVVVGQLTMSSLETSV